MFLNAHQRVLATPQRDYTEWHRNRKKFAVWYLQVESAECVAYCQQLTQHFSDLLIQPMSRQYHVTLFVCGFWQKQLQLADDFSQAQLIKQLESLQQIKLTSIQLQSGAIRSFQSSLCLEIFDPQNSLSGIRNILAQHATEIRAQVYLPHLTLGIYNQAYHYDQIMACIAQAPQQQFNLTCRQLYFGYYQPHILQGPLYAAHTLQLDSLCCD